MLVQQGKRGGVTLEFHEKLQELRKSRGLTQEELAEALYVSRTAISKWESGRGYPSIDSLKEIASYFSVTIDELLSGEKLLSIAEKENKSNLLGMCDFLFGMMDVCSLLLIILPLYPNLVEGYIYSVNLFAYTQASTFHRTIYWIMLLLLIAVGMLKIMLTELKIKKVNRLVTVTSMFLSILTVLFLAMAREAYAIMVVFLLLVIKGMLLLKIKI